MKRVLEGMGIETQLESEYKYRCVLVKRKKGTMGPAGGASGTGLAAVTMVGSAGSNGVRFLVVSLVDITDKHLFALG